VTTTEGLLSHFSVEALEPARFARVRPDLFLARTVGASTPMKMNQETLPSP
jgi:hypothetical protein